MDMPVDNSEIEVRACPPRGVFRTMENLAARVAHLGDELRARGAGLACHGLVVRDDTPLSGAGGGVG